ncbi:MULTISPECIES: hypothetical protein [Pseudomonas]|uniref:hypothetical protein n=1 Tax=Pseudomonas TaxID=286 RepID=UPI0008DFDCD3|nr:hypothetical protein [Pseudomonas marincola]SFT82277.1 hypothetical protein SAMN05216264_104318 [Pseudomonas marincola]
MIKIATNPVIQGIADAFKMKSQAMGIDTTCFGLRTDTHEDGQIIAYWEFSTTGTDGNIYIDFLDDVNDSNEVILDHTLNDFSIELTAEQKEIFLEFEPQLRVLRRILQVQEKLESLHDEVCC